MSQIKKSNIRFYGEKKQERKKYTINKEKDRKYEKGEEKKACSRNQVFHKVQRLNSLKEEYTYIILCFKGQTKLYDNNFKMSLTPFATQL